jgi:hypothetical protein
MQLLNQRLTNKGHFILVKAQETIPVSVGIQ